MGFHFGVGAGLVLQRAGRLRRRFVDADQPSDGIDGNTKCSAAWLALSIRSRRRKNQAYILGGVGFYNTKISSGGSDTSKTQSALRRRWYPLPLTR